MIVEEMDDFKGERSLQGSEDDQSQEDTTRLLSAGDETDERWSKSMYGTRQPSRRDTHAMIAILLMCVTLNFFQGAWLVGDSVRFASGT